MVYFKGFKDHHAFTNSELNDLITGSESSKADCLLTTEKDWVRLESIAREIPELGYLTVEFALSDRDAFFGLMRRKAKEVGIY